MPCQEIRSWTFNGLVGAFLDLAIALLLLCASALVYLTSKFLGLFGLNLPCPCDGLFSDPNKNKCFQEILGNFPVEKISSIHGSIKSKIPFDSIFTNDQKYQVKEKRNETGDVVLEGEASCSFIPGKGSEDVAGEERGLRNDISSGFGLLSSQSLKKGSFEIKSKDFSVHRSPYGLRRRQKGAFGHGKFSSVPVYGNRQPDAHASPEPSSSVTKLRNDAAEKDPVSVNSEEEGKALEDSSWHKSVSHGSELDEPSTENKLSERTSSSVKENMCSSPVDLNFDGNSLNTIRILEQALEEEQAAHAVLCLELEKERNAAATAADEAMAMILRLQEDKASIEMEARQYQRMIQEKSAFDAEEMNILKEILFRREREKHVLEKEVEAYRQMFLENEQSESNLQDMEATHREGRHFLYSNEDPGQISHRMSETFVERAEMETVNNIAESEILPNRIENCVLAFGNKLAVPSFDDDADSMKLGKILQGPVETNPACEETITPVQDKKRESDKSNPFPDLVPKASQSCDETKTIIPYCDDRTEKDGESSHSSCLNVDRPVHDIHVIGDEVSMSNEVSGSKTHQPQVNVPLDYPQTSDAASLVQQDLKLDRSRSVSDMAHRLPPICPTRSKTFSSDMRRKSMSAVDYERLKIENEVGWLRGRLRVIQQGREKLNLSVGHREREKTQLQLLDNVTSQLREIQQLTDAGRWAQQVSLPPASSKAKVMSKKRRWRSATLDLHSA